MVMCCPLSEPDDYCTVYNVDQRRARKEHVCGECRETIGVGELHEYITMLFDGQWSSHRQCLLCSEIGDHFSCGRGRLLETLWEDLRSNFFPDMVAGGPCMQGLSPAAKQKLIDARMEWYFDQDEIEDSAWEDWPKHRDRQRPLRPAPVEREEPVSYYDTPEYYWKRELELDKFREERLRGKVVRPYAAVWSLVPSAEMPVRLAYFYTVTVQQMPKIQRDDVKAAALAKLAECRRWLAGVLERNGYEVEAEVIEDDDDE